jgi:hypothetical protein
MIFASASVALADLAIGSYAPDIVRRDGDHTMKRLGKLDLISAPLAIRVHDRALRQDFAIVLQRMFERDGGEFRNGSSCIGCIATTHQR